MRWEEGLEKLRRDQIEIDALGDLAGWWFLEVDANLTEERIEMVKTHVDPESMYDRFDLRTALLRLFPNLHLTEARRANLQREIPSRFSWQRQRDDRWTTHGATGSRGGGKGGDARRSYGKGRQINTIEDEEGSLGSEESEYDDDGGYEQVAGGDQPNLQVTQVPQAELGQLQDDLDSLSENDSTYSPGEQAELEAAAATLSNVSDALEVVRNFRKKTRQGRTGKGRRPEKGFRGEAVAAEGKPSRKGGRGASPAKESLASRKLKSRCRVCSLPGHWAGDPADGQKGIPKP